MFAAVIIGRLADYAVERCIERLTVGKTYHLADFFNRKSQKTFVDKLVLCLLDAIFVYEARKICVEA